MHSIDTLATLEPGARPISNPLTATVLLAGATGARCLLGIAATSRVLSHSHAVAAEQPARSLSTSRARLATTALAAMELAGDKVPGISNRTDPGPIVGRALTGAVIGAVIGEVSGRNRVTSALIGAASAVVGAHLTFQLRKQLMNVLPAVPAALVEDAIVMGIASLGAAALSEG
jgi:uncharacterized membrane protein